MSKGKPTEAFNVQSILEKIERRMAAGDDDGAIMEINRPWPDMDSDIGMAVKALMAELSRNGTVPLFLKDFTLDEDTDTVAFEFPDWFHAANRAFAQRYPDPKEAGLRFQKTMAVLQQRLLLLRENPQSGFECDAESRLCDCSSYLNSDGTCRSFSSSLPPHATLVTEPCEAGGTTYPILERGQARSAREGRICERHAGRGQAGWKG